jgi:hypothetical protein
MERNDCGGNVMGRVSMGRVVHGASFDGGASCLEIIVIIYLYYLHSETVPLIGRNVGWFRNDEGK